MLKIRTGFSFREAVGQLDEVMDRLIECKAPVAPITDRASTFGWLRWKKLAVKKGLKPVFGIELAVTPSLNEKRPATDHWTFLARGSVKPINELVALATDQFRYQPLLNVEQALTAARDCFVMTGHRPIIADWSAVKAAGVTVALGPSSVVPIIKRAIAHKIPLVATSDNRYPKPDDAQFYETLAGRHASLQLYPQHILSQNEWLAAVAHFGLSTTQLATALANAEFQLVNSSADLERASLPEPVKAKTLKAMCLAGAKELKCDLKNKVYAARLKRELELIEAKGYDDYFYIVADLCQWARKTMIVGPARGSSCGSLVCYLLKITTVDPIPHGLIFERFIDVNRNDMPDIDIDFSDQQRHLVFDYLKERYGADRVARLGVVTMYKPRSALVDAGMALRIPKYICDSVADGIIERSSGDSRALHTLEDTLAATPAGKRLLTEYPEAKIITRFEGHPRHYSQHAAGVVIAADAISNYVATDLRTGATMCDKKDAEEGYNLLKIDALGLTQLSVFEDALEMARLPQGKLETLPLNDKKAFEVLNKHQFAGIFQFNGQALQGLTRMFTVTEFNDIVSVTALARPGPLASGGANEWVRRRNKQSFVTYPHPLFKPYLEETLGVVLYQEQVMEIGRNIGDLDWGQVTALRKAMSKSLGKEFFDQFGTPWKTAAIAKGVKPEDASRVWDELCAYGSWSFNKSHSVAYGLISYWCCWLKAHFPFEFAAAALSHEKDPNAQILLLREMVAEGFGYMPVDRDISTDRWTVGLDKNGAKRLVGPLSNVRGIGPATMSAVLSARKRGEPMPSRALKLLENPVTPIDSLWPIRDAFARLLPDPTVKNIYSTPQSIITLKPEAEDKEVLIFCTLSRITPRSEMEPVRVAQREAKGKRKEWLGNPSYLNLTLRDDTDTIFANMRPGTEAYRTFAEKIIERGRPNSCLYAVKGVLGGHRGNLADPWRGVKVTAVKYIGDMDDESAYRSESQFAAEHRPKPSTDQPEEYDYAA